MSKYLFVPNCYSQQRQREKPARIYPVLLAMEATYKRNQGHEVIWEEHPTREQIANADYVHWETGNKPFLFLPHPDRIWTKAKEYTSGNYKYLPGTHIMSASGCWHGKCSFCVENGQPYEVRPVEDVISEIEECKALGFKEVFDDSATFPMGKWLEKFCNLSSKLSIRLGCNCRIANYDYSQLRRGGFRMLLFGIESANQQTLDKINKGVKVEDIIPTLKKATETGLENHIAVMFGYPWETDDDAIRTLKLVHFLLRKGYAKTAQASFYKTNEVSNENHRKYVKQIYDIWQYPEFWFNQIKDIKDIDDIKYLWRKIKEGLRR